jgi:zinc transport system substrate-binding protein
VQLIRPFVVGVVGMMIAALVGGCGSGSGATSFEPGKVNVAVALYPIEEIVRSVGGSAVSVIELVPPGESAHDYEPTPQQVTALQSAQLVFYLGGGFQPNVEKAIASLPAGVRKVDLLANLSLIAVVDQLAGTAGTTAGEVLGNGADPHVWLSPDNMKLMAADVVAALRAMSAVDAGGLTARATAYGVTMDDLDRSFRAGLSACRSHVIVTSHRAFGYLAKSYGLRQIAISGISPAAEPSAKTLQAVAGAARENNVTTIFFENNLPSDLANTIAREVGATTAVLDPVETLSKDQIDAHANYVSVMQQNLVALEKGLGCS